MIRHAFFFLLCAVFASGAQIKLHTEYNPPWNYKENGQVTGIAARAVEAIANEAGGNYSIDLLPWNRAYTLALHRQNHAVFSTLRTKEREDKFYWIGPLYQEKFYLYEHSDAPTGAKTLQEAKEVGLIDTGPDQNALHRLLKKEGFTNLSFLSKNLADVRALQSGRVDLVALGEISIQAQCKRAGIDCSRLRPLPPLLSQRAYYLAFSKATDASVIQRWKKAYEKLKQQGTFAAIKKRFLKDEK